MISLIRGIIELVDSCDAKINTDEGIKVLNDPEKLKKVNKSISDRKGHGPIIIKF